MKKKEKTVSQLQKELDVLFSRHIRYSNSEDGVCTCYTCGHKNEVKKMHAGHYITRFFKTTRWDERNVKPQCFMCNIYRKGNAVLFRQNLVRDYGLPAVEEMEKSVNFLLRGGLKREWLEEKIAYYKEKTKNI